MPTEGEIRLKGNLIKHPGPDRMMVFQEFDQLLPWKTVKQNVMFPLESSTRMSRREVEDRAMHYINKVNLANFADAHPHTLSGGMKQRVAIARVLANNANILLMDEPFGALDALTREQLQHELLHIWSRSRVTILFVTHSVEEAALLADRVLVMSAGPGRIESDIRIDLPRPRDVSSPEFNAVRRDLARRLTSHISTTRNLETVA